MVDRLKGFPEASTTVFPQTAVQTRIVHLIRNGLAFVSWKDRMATLCRDQGDLPRRPLRGRSSVASEAE
jgi:transposase-like protein